MRISTKKPRAKHTHTQMGLPTAVSHAETSHTYSFFCCPATLSEKQREQVKRVSSFYTENMLRSTILPILNKTHRVSLRALDWFVTNYAKKYPVVFLLQRENKPDTLVNIHLHYKKWLYSYKRRNFDMFRRSGELYFMLDGKKYMTTAGQLNFFHWAIKYDIVKYAHTHINAIEQDHAITNKLAKKRKIADKMSGTVNTRCELSAAPLNKCTVYNIPLTIIFDEEERK